MAQLKEGGLEWEEAELDLADEITDEDYVFVVKPDGSVKSILLPSIETDMSEGIRDLMDFIEDKSSLSSAGHILH
jgi:hypothetical protein